MPGYPPRARPLLPPHSQPSRRSDPDPLLALTTPGRGSSSGVGARKGEIKAQFTCCYRCETSLDAPRMSRGPPNLRPDCSHQRRRPLPDPGPEVPQAAGVQPAPPPAPSNPAFALDPRVFAAQREQGAPGPGARSGRPGLCAPGHQPAARPTPTTPKPGPMAAGRGGTSVRVKRRGRARGL